MGEKGDWYLKAKQIKGILSDITGVLYNGGEGGGQAIPGSIAAVEKLTSAGVPLRFCTNETQCTTAQVAAKLGRLGFSITESQIFSPAPAARALLKERGLRPHLLVYPDVLPEFADLDQTDPTCVVLGEAAEHFSYSNMNKTFQVLSSMAEPVLFTLGLGKFYRHGGSLQLDVGPYAKALEYACDVKAEVVGKPAPMFYQQALADLGVTPDQALMIGDDIISDVGGAQKCGMMGIQVRTGKYRPSDEPHDHVRPDGYVDNFAQFVDLYLQHHGG